MDGSMSGREIGPLGALTLRYSLSTDQMALSTPWLSFPPTPAIAASPSVHHSMAGVGGNDKQVVVNGTPHELRDITKSPLSQQTRNKELLSGPWGKMQFLVSDLVHGREVNQRLTEGQPRDRRLHREGKPPVTVVVDLV